MGQPHVLIVDDDPLVIETLTTFLEIEGCRVSDAFSCGKAIERLRSTDPIDLAILDYLLPDGSAVDLLQQIGKETGIQCPPIIMSSGILDPQSPVWDELRRRLPVKSQNLLRAYVSKPYSLDAMEVALQEALSGDYLPDSSRRIQARKIRPRP